MSASLEPVATPSLWTARTLHATELETAAVSVHSIDRLWLASTIAAVERAFISVKLCATRSTVARIPSGSPIAAVATEAVALTTFRRVAYRILSDSANQLTWVAIARSGAILSASAWTLVR